ncbi:SDR family NAD(P)-dependent oxidoreductase [Marimonas sp. MJW-29]|uniref:SDR family NAD(P)-dependent oxidoreductase n=1 Tax=Sulfitobacter sediminis TaxID=3234186 RepID=A0ABV3RVF2_9RHOB
MDISGAVAFVTGGSGGLGSRICTLLSDEGVCVAIGFHHGEERAEEVKQRIEAAGGSAFTIQVDQTDPHSIESAVSKIVTDQRSLDIVVNNAAIASGGHSIELGDLDAFTPAIWDEMMAVNVKGPYLVTRAAASHLRVSKWGRVVNIGSTLGHGDWYQDRIFAPSKAAVIPLTRFLAAALAPDVTVNCVAPGLMVETALGGGGPKPGADNEVYDMWQNRAALKSFTEIDDVASQVIYLCKSSTITGQSIGIDAGVHFH